MTQIPKKPLAVSRAKRKLPMELDWGPGVPKDRLRYINAKEEALIKKHRVSKAARDYAGVKAYPDIGDTKAGGSTGLKDGASTRGADGPSGVGRGSGSGGSSPSSSASKSSSGSTSASSQTGGGSKSSSTSSAAASTPSRAPNAAAQAASNKLNASQSSAKAPATNYSASGTVSRSPNAAAQAASNKLNATASALKTGQQPQSIQGMINTGQYAPNGSYYGPKGINSLNASAYGAATRSAQTAPNGSYYGPKGGTSLNSDARFAAARSVGFNPDPVQRTPGDAEAMGRMMMAESASIKNKYGNPITAGLQGVGDVIRNRMLSDQFPNTVGKVMAQRNQFSPVRDGRYADTPANAMATSIAESILSGESPSVVGNALNYSNENTVNNKPGYSSAASRASVNAMTKEFTVSDYNNPKTFSHTFGTRDGTSDVSFNGTGTPSAGSVGLAAATEPSAPRPQAIPSPISTAMLGNTPQRTPLAPPTIPNASTIVSGDPRVGMKLPNGLPAASTRTAAATPSGPATYSPVSAPEDVPAVYSENPMQGSQNPMQEGENPQVKKDRQMKYANTGATIGGVIAGPIGTVVGATLGWQMGKTPPGQRQAIANNPQALNANVQSINTMVEERGGKGNPQMRVTDKGLKDVLTDPAKVSAEPEKYTTLEQMLAALAQGIDPETGKPIA